jgi:KipI family sensor histidine kinase inhibitor
MWRAPDHGNSRVAPFAAMPPGAPGFQLFQDYPDALHQLGAALARDDDIRDADIRVAPSFQRVKDARQATDLISLCAIKAAVDKARGNDKTRAAPARAGPGGGPGGGETGTANPGPFDISDMGETGLLLNVTDPIDLAAQRVIWRLAKAQGYWPSGTDATAGVNTLLVQFDPACTDAEEITGLLEAGWNSPPAWDHVPTHHRIPVRYGGAHGGDLAEVADHVGLSQADYIARHAAGSYTVMTVGAQAGFGYLGGLDPALAVPRRATPRPGIRAGAVMIGGAQTAVATVTSPSGWSVIGHTDAWFFDPARRRPARLELGDTVSFAPESTA